MIIGVPKEIREHEYRVGLTPFGAGALKEQGHRVIIESSAGEGSGFHDDEYKGAGAEISDRSSLYRDSDLIVKVKEPLPSEYGLFREYHAIFTFLHLAANPGLTEFLLKKKIAGFAYGTLEKDHTLPLLAPMSEIAGRMAPVMAAYYLQTVYKGRGLLLTGAEGAEPASVVVLGAGVVGRNAAIVAHGMGARVTVINRGTAKLRIIDEMFKAEVRTTAASKDNIEEYALKADVLIGAVLIPGAKAPRLVSRDLVSRMKKGSVIVDVSVDQGGCIETTRPTTHTDPVYIVNDVIHYCVSNMPGAYPRTSTVSLTNRTLPYIQELAKNGIEWAAEQDSIFQTALNTYKGKIMNRAVAGSF